MSRWLNDYSFALPRERIAQRPSRVRDGARLLVLRRGTDEITHSRFRSLPGFLQEGDLVVVNDSAVVPARLRGRKRSGGRFELLLLERLGGERWHCLMKGKAAAGTELTFGDGDVGAVIERTGSDGEVTVAFTPRRGWRLLLARKGETPLPPYIRRPAGEEGRGAASDRARYQTLYAAAPGSVAAPTAGLHFTSRVRSALQRRGVQWERLTLHVGAGTFRPLKVNDLSRARLAAERVFVPARTARAFNRTKKSGGRVIAVGTTVTRALEALAGADGRMRGGRLRVDLLIRPGYRFRAIDGLVTNFHLPRSSLFLLVSAFAGRERMLEVYRKAVEEQYRFYSYGDSMLIL